MTKYVGCEECIYQDVCEEFDPFFGCNNGRQVTQTNTITLNKELGSNEYVER